HLVVVDEESDYHRIRSLAKHKAELFPPSFPFLRHAKKLDGADRGSVAGLNVEFFKHVQDVLFYRVARRAEDEANLFIVFALGDPEQHLRFARRKTEGFQRHGGRKIW